MVSDKKYEAILDMMIETMDAYHKVANMVLSDRHVSESWRNCTEETCILFRRNIAKITEME